jgi:mono/diheme cytochrome c family protein
MGLAEGPDGSLYISDTEKGKIWRVMFKGNRTWFNEENLRPTIDRKMASNIRRPDEIADNLDKLATSNGEKIYKTYCGSCHQNNGKGASDRFPPLAANSWVSGDKPRLIDIVLRGLEGPIMVNDIPFNGFMPQHSFLTDEDIAAVLTYVRNSFGNHATPVTAEEVGARRIAP